ncbi:MAG: S9 family peptidase [Anaerolineae bacterium]|nr:S9 family peptidase [Anaerolineae bacterium]
MTTHPYGTWPSPISAQDMAYNTRLNDVQWDTRGHTLVWSERRDGQTRLAAKMGDLPARDLTGADMKVGGGVGYGGGDFCVSEGNVYFCSNGRLYRMGIDHGTPKALTPKYGGVAAPTLSYDGKWLVYVHTYENQDVLAVVDAKGDGWPQKLASGDDFVMQPSWHPHGKYLAYVAWNAPNMPWNGTELRLLTLDGTETMPHVTNSRTVAGDETTAIFQPTFSPNGRYLAYISDEGGFGQLYLYDPVNDQHKQLTDSNYEHGTPAWIQGLRTFTWSADSNSIVFIRHAEGICTLWRYDLGQGTATQIPLDDYTHLSQPDLAPDGTMAVMVSSSTIPGRIISISPDNTVDIVHYATSERIAPSALSECEPIKWPTRDGQMAHGIFSPPIGDYESPGLPPIVVLIHGGPTSQRLAAYDNDAQFFATRGYAVLQVNHRGSTGYGKDYMNMHQGNWGIYDVQDAVDAVKHLAHENLIDGNRAAIMGGSAGGFTVLQALIDEPGFFKAGICMYGVTNQFSLAMDTHKFEASYNDWLLGPLPESAELYRERSPLFHADKIKDALVIFQGSEDPVVPKSQSDSIVATLQRNGTTLDYHVYEGEGHGFRQPKNVIHQYETIEKFLLTHLIYA